MAGFLGLVERRAHRLPSTCCCRPFRSEGRHPPANFKRGRGVAPQGSDGQDGSASMIEGIAGSKAHPAWWRLPKKLKQVRLLARGDPTDTGSAWVLSSDSSLAVTTPLLPLPASHCPPPSRGSSAPYCPYAPRPYMSVPCPICAPPRLLCSIISTACQLPVTAWALNGRKQSPAPDPRTRSLHQSPAPEPRTRATHQSHAPEPRTRAPHQSHAPEPRTRATHQSNAPEQRTRVGSEPSVEFE